LSGNDSKGHANACANGFHKLQGAQRMIVSRSHDDPEGFDNQCVAAQHSNTLVERAVNGRVAATQVGVVEAGQIIMDQGGAMQQFERAGGR
jgi:predicted methyltransferase MtxX (methanogen marker protein 4)